MNRCLAVRCVLHTGAGPHCCRVGAVGLATTTSMSPIPTYGPLHIQGRSRLGAFGLTVLLKKKGTLVADPTVCSFCTTFLLSKSPTLVSVAPLAVPGNSELTKHHGCSAVGSGTAVEGGVEGNILPPG